MGEISRPVVINHVLGHTLQKVTLDDIATQKVKAVDMKNEQGKIGDDHDVTCSNQKVPLSWI